MLKILIVIPLLQAAYYSWTSRINQFFFFGRSVPAEFAASPEARNIQRKYRLQIWLGSLLAVIVGMLLYGRDISTAWLWGTLIEVMVFYFAFGQANGATGRNAPQSPTMKAVEAELAGTGDRPPSMMALLAPVVTGVVILLIGLFEAASRASLGVAPQVLDRLVTAHGGERLFGFGMGMAVAGLAAALIRNTTRSRTPLAHQALWSSMIATWAGVAVMTFAMSAAYAGHMISGVETKAVLYGIILLALGVVLFRMVVNRRYRPPSAEMNGDESWRWGLLYSNRNDPAIFVQCRCGPGFTLNYGRPLAWPILAMFMGLLVTVLVTLGHR